MLMVTYLVSRKAKWQLRKDIIHFARVHRMLTPRKIVLKSYVSTKVRPSFQKFRDPDCCRINRDLSINAKIQL